MKRITLTVFITLFILLGIAGCEDNIHDATTPTTSAAVSETSFAESPSEFIDDKSDNVPKNPRRASIPKRNPLPLVANQARLFIARVPSRAHLKKPSNNHPRKKQVRKTKVLLFLKRPSKKNQGRFPQQEVNRKSSPRKRPLQAMRAQKKVRFPKHIKQKLQLRNQVKKIKKRLQFPSKAICLNRMLLTSSMKLNPTSRRCKCLNQAK